MLLGRAPDVILIGEIRDTETMEAAITFAETGHLCLGTLHSNNANQAIERIMNFFPSERHAQIYLQLSLNLRSIVSQRLIPSLEGKRIAALEILMDTPRIKDLIKKGDVDTLKQAMEQGIQEGCQTFDQALFDLFDHKARLLQLLDVSGRSQGVQIYIGGESKLVPLEELSMVVAPYEVDGKVVGTLGVIGPTRMAYERVIPIVDITAKLLSNALSRD